MHGKEDAFTGLEAAIVFIAFVVVAAVFSYIVLSAGFFTTQKSQEVIHAGVTEAVSNIVLDGDVYLTLPDGVSQVIQFDITPAAGNSPVDVDKLQIMMSTHNSNPAGTIPQLSLWGSLSGTWILVCLLKKTSNKNERFTELRRISYLACYPSGYHGFDTQIPAYN